VKTRSAKSKGRRLQNQVREDLICALGIHPKLIRCALMGENGADIKDVSGKLPIAIECKNTESLSIWGALAQAEANCDDGLTPCLVFKRNKSKTYAAIPWEYFLALLRSSESPLEAITHNDIVVANYDPGQIISDPTWR